MYHPEDLQEIDAKLLPFQFGVSDWFRTDIVALLQELLKGQSQTPAM